MTDKSNDGSNDTITDTESRVRQSLLHRLDSPIVISQRFPDGNVVVQRGHVEDKHRKNLLEGCRVCQSYQKPAVSVQAEVTDDGIIKHCTQERSDTAAQLEWQEPWRYFRVILVA